MARLFMNDFGSFVRLGRPLCKVWSCTYSIGQDSRPCGFVACDWDISLDAGFKCLGQLLRGSDLGGWELDYFIWPHICCTLYGCVARTY